MEKEPEVEFNLKFEVPDDLPTLYANEMTVQAFHSEFVLSFFEVRPPIITKESKQPFPSEIPTKCVGRIAVSIARIPSFIKSLQEQFKEQLITVEDTVGDEVSK